MKNQSLYLSYIALCGAAILASGVAHAQNSIQVPAGSVGVITSDPAVPHPSKLTPEETAALTGTASPAPTTHHLAGIVSQFDSDTLVLRTKNSDAPVSYASTETTTYVNENGAVLNKESVKSGMPVTVYYTKDGNTMTATKVVMKKATTP